MKFAVRKGERVKAQPGLSGVCPLCNEEVIPKCGEIKIWHWAHKTKEDCDSWSEGETEWHLNWKAYFPEEMQEIVIGNHRADIRTREGQVIEFQKNNLSPEKIINRECFYGNMIWVLDGEKIAKNLNLREKPGYYTFRWKHPPKCWWYAKKPIYIDFGNDYLFVISKIYPNIPCGGSGKFISKQSFIVEKGGNPFKKTGKLNGL